MKYFIDCDHITICYPYETTQKLKYIGVLEQYRGKKYSLKEINVIIADLIIKTPYVDNAMGLEIHVLWTEKNVTGYHHLLSFKNYWYEKQKRTEASVKFMFG